LIVRPIKYQKQLNPLAVLALATVLGKVVDESQLNSSGIPNSLAIATGASAQTANKMPHKSAFKSKAVESLSRFGASHGFAERE